MKYTFYYYIFNIPKSIYNYNLLRTNHLIQIVPNYYLLDFYDKKHDIFHYNTKYRRNFKKNVFKKNLVDNHHIIPKQFQLHPLIQQLNIDLACSKNIVFLPNRYAKDIYYNNSIIYHDSHPKYNKYIQKELDFIHSIKDKNEKSYQFILFFMYLQQCLEQNNNYIRSLFS